MITQAARLSARHQVGHHNPILAFSRGNRSLFSTFNASPSGTRKYVMPSTPVTPDPPKPEGPQMTQPAVGLTARVLAPFNESYPDVYLITEVIDSVPKAYVLGDLGAFDIAYLEVLE